MFNPSLSSTFIWDKVTTLKFIKRRIKDDVHFNGKPNSATIGFMAIIKELKIPVTEKQARSKWQNLVYKYREVKRYIEKTNNYYDKTMISWPFYDILDSYFTKRTYNQESFEEDYKKTNQNNGGEMQQQEFIETNFMSNAELVNQDLSNFETQNNYIKSEILDEDDKNDNIFSDMDQNIDYENIVYNNNVGNVNDINYNLDRLISVPEAEQLIMETFSFDENRKTYINRNQSTMSRKPIVKRKYPSDTMESSSTYHEQPLPKLSSNSFHMAPTSSKSNNHNVNLIKTTTEISLDKSIPITSSVREINKTAKKPDRDIKKESSTNIDDKESSNSKSILMKIKNMCSINCEKIVSLETRTSAIENKLDLILNSLKCIMDEKKSFKRIIKDEDFIAPKLPFTTMAEIEKLNGNLITSSHYLEQMVLYISKFCVGTSNITLQVMEYICSYDSICSNLWDNSSDAYNSTRKIDEIINITLKNFKGIISLIKEVISYQHQESITDESIQKSIADFIKRSSQNQCS